MNAKQYNKHTSNLAVSAVFEKFTVSVESVPKLKLLATEFKKINDLVITVTGRQSEPVQVASEAKNASREAMALYVTAGQGMLNAASDELKDPDVTGKLTRSESWLKTRKTAEVTAYSEQVARLVKRHKVALAGVGADDAFVAAMDAAVEAWKASSVAPRSAAVDRSSATAELDGLLEKQDKLAEETLDELMAQFKLKAPEFYRAYKQARTIIDRGGKGEDGDTPPTTPPPAK